MPIKILCEEGELLLYSVRDAVPLLYRRIGPSPAILPQTAMEKRPQRDHGPLLSSIIPCNTVTEKQNGGVYKDFAS